MDIRPSILPKVAACARYESEPFAGAAANRGTEMDAHYRGILSTTAPEDRATLIGEMRQSLESDAVAAVLWAVDVSELLAGGHPLLSAEDDLRIEACGMTGTADLACPVGRWSADLKSGEIRNYLEQQAAYAVGFMDRYFEDEWTIHLIYCDQREVVTHHFTRDEAERIVRQQIARRSDDQIPPTPCDYCGWCARRFTCLPRLEQAMPLVPVVEAESPERAFEAILADNDKAYAFLKACKVVEDLKDKAREVVKDRLVEGKASGLKIKGISLVTKKGSQVLPAEALVAVGKKIGPQKLLAALGTVTRSKAEKLFAEAGIEMPADQLIETPGSVYIQIR